jgi:NodT family efflux transporter outer membrane factor (OMF) lipoprotein
MSMPHPIRLAAIVAPLLAGCAAGPDFVRPAAPNVGRYTSDALPDKTAASEVHGGEGQRFLAGEEVSAQWWTLFQSSALDTLIEQSFKANPNLQAAQAALRVAQENMRAQQGAYFPTVSADVNASRQKTAPVFSPTLDSGASPYSLHTAQVLVSYPLDVFGGNRRQVESLAAQADSQRFQLEAARVTLATNVAAAFVQIASLRDQITALHEVLRLQIDQLAILRKQFELGEIAEAAVITQEAALAQTQTQVPSLEKQLAQQNDALSVLLGKLPSEAEIASFSLDDLSLPEDLPLSLPSKLVDRRPDVRAAEADLHAASAQIGVAVANRLPQMTLSASRGSTTTRFADLFTVGTGFWSVAADIAQPIFQGGTLLHRQRAAEAAYDQAAAQYRSVVIGAFQNVADTLQALQYDADGLRAATAAERKTKESLDIARKQLELGDVSYLSVVVAEQAYQQAVLARVQAQANRYADTAALFQALGGGWLDQPDLARSGDASSETKR